MSERTGQKGSKIHETLAAALLLALAGGFLDAYTFVLKNGVFANAQTGNLIFLSLALFTGKYGEAPKYVLPIVFFSLGIVLSEHIKTVDCITSESKKIKAVLLCKSALLIVIGISSPLTEDIVTTCAVSFLAAVQVGVFNKLEGSAVATTMITGNLKSAMQNAYSFFYRKDSAAGKRFWQYCAVIVFFGIGAGAGAFLTDRFKDRAIYFCLLFFAAVYAIVCAGDKKERPA